MMRELLLSIFSLLFLYLTRLVRVDVAGNVLTEEFLTNKINALGCHMLNGLYKDTAADENILVSPVIAYSALALLHLGAGGSTREEVADVIRLADFKNSTEIHQKLKTLLSKFLSNPDEPKFHETILANAVFLQDGFPVKASYLELAKEYYDGVAKNVDFKDKSEDTTNEINNWISKSTKGRVDKFFDEPVSGDTQAILTSALYFNAQWKTPFSTDDTKNGTFRIGTEEIQTPMMAVQRHLFYVSDYVLHYDSVTLPYAGHEYEMIVYLQHEGHTSDESTLGHLYHHLAEQNFTINIGSRQLVDLKLPKMKFVWKNSLVTALNLGKIFKKPDLSEMTSQNNLEISNMLHAVELEADEKGSVGTAATAVEVNLVSTPFNLAKKDPVQFYVDRPFLLILRHVRNDVRKYLSLLIAYSSKRFCDDIEKVRIVWESTEFLHVLTSHQVMCLDRNGIYLCSWDTSCGTFQIHHDSQGSKCGKP